MERRAEGNQVQWGWVVGGEVPGTVVGCRARVVVGGVCQWRREAWWDQKVEGEARERDWARSWGCWGWPSGWEGGLGDMLGVTVL